MTSRSTRALVLAWAFVLAAAAPASAGTARADNRAFTTFDAAVGEINVLSGSPIDGGNLMFSDSGAPVTPGPGCTSLSANTVSCGTRDGGVTVTLGDGNDSADFTAMYGSVTIDGGAGEDTLTGSPGPDIVYPGEDVDTVRTLEGGDTISGLPGDLLFAGPGDDYISTGEARTPGPESVIDCGPGADKIWTLRSDLAQRNCESWVSDALIMKTHGTLTRRALVFRASCNGGGLGQGADCSGRLRLRREDGTSIGTVRYDNGDRRRFSIVFRLRPADRQIIDEGRILGIEEVGGAFGFKMLQRG